MHAHKCTVCESKGISTVWIHGDQHANQVAAHKCPKCGSENWRKWMVESGQLPQQNQQRGGIVQVVLLNDALVMVFTYAFLVLLIVGIAQNWDKIITYIQKVRQ